MERKYKKVENDKVLKDRFTKGYEFFSSFTVENIFNEVKNIVRKHIPEDAVDSLDSSTLYNLVCTENKISQIYFSFGVALSLYEVTLDALNLRITLKDPNKWRRPIYSCKTYDLTKD